MASKYTGKSVAETLYSEALAESIRVAIETEQIDPDSFCRLLLNRFLRRLNNDTLA